MNAPKYEPPRICTGEELAEQYAAENTINLTAGVSLAIQRAYLDGMLKGFGLAREAIAQVTEQAPPPAANEG